MRLASQSIWALVGASGYLGAVARAAGVLDIGLVFPRTNATYSPADDFPIVFAVQNSKLAEHLKASIWLKVLNVTGDIEDTETLIDSLHEFNWTSASEHDPYLLWSRVKVGGEGKLRVLWEPHWTSCDSHEEVGLARNYTDTFLVDFEIRASGEKADLVAATNNGISENCPNAGVGIDVTNKTLEAATRSSNGSSAHETVTCAVLGSSSPTGWPLPHKITSDNNTTRSTPISNPCKVQLDKATVESMAAADLKEKCRGLLDPPSECPKGGLANPRFAVAGVSTLAAVFSAALFLA